MKGARFRSLPENAKPGIASPARSQPASATALAPLRGGHPLHGAGTHGGSGGGGSGGRLFRIGVGEGVAAGGVTAGCSGGGGGLGFTFTLIFSSRHSIFSSVASPLNHFRVACARKSPVSFGNISMLALRLRPAGSSLNVMLHKAAVQASVISVDLTDQPVGTVMTI